MFKEILEFINLNYKFYLSISIVTLWVTSLFFSEYIEYAAIWLCVAFIARFFYYYYKVYKQIPSFLNRKNLRTLNVLRFKRHSMIDYKSDSLKPRTEVRKVRQWLELEKEIHELYHNKSRKRQYKVVADLTDYGFDMIITIRVKKYGYYLIDYATSMDSISLREIQQYIDAVKFMGPKTK